MQEEDRLTDALENNYKAVGILYDKVEKLESRLSETLPKLDDTVSSLRGASKITIGEESRRALAREGEAVCQKIAGRIDKESAKLLDRLSMKDRVVISTTAFWCMIEVIIFLLVLSSAPAWPTSGSYTVSCCGKYSVIPLAFLPSVLH